VVLGRKSYVSLFAGNEAVLDRTPSVRRLNQGQSASVRILGCCAAAQDLVFSNSTGVR
jgi:hypothetical protein